MFEIIMNLVNYFCKMLFLLIKNKYLLLYLILILGIFCSNTCTHLPGSFTPSSAHSSVFYLSFKCLIGCLDLGISLIAFLLPLTLDLALLRRLRIRDILHRVIKCLIQTNINKGIQTLINIVLERMHV